MKPSINRYRVISSFEINQFSPKPANHVSNDSLSEDTYVEKVKKYIPIEIVGGYFFLYKFLIDSNVGSTQQYLFGIIFFSCLVLTPLYKYFQLSDNQLPPPTRQVVISSLSFIAWSYYLGGLSKALSLLPYDSILATVIMVLFTLITPLIEKITNHFINQKN